MKILKNYLYNLSYQIISIIVPIITIPYISRVLGADLIGINSYTNTIISYFVLFANIGLTVYGNRTISYARDSLEERSQKFWEIMVIKLLMAILSYFCFFVFTLFYTQYRTYLYIQSIQILAVAIDISWFFTGLEDFKKTVTRNILTKILSAICVILIVKTREDLGKYILIITGSALVGNLTLWTYIKRYISSFDFKSMNLREHLKPVIVLFIPQLATTLFMTLNKLFLGNLSTFTEAGFFDNSDKIVRVLLTAITAVGTVIFPKLANSFKKNDNSLINKYLKLSFDAVNMISIPITFGLISISSPFSEIYFGSDFDGIELTLAILSIELIFMGWSTVFGNQFLVAIDKVKGLTISVVIATVVLLSLSIFLIPIFGSTGATITSVIGEAVIAIVQLYFVNKYVQLSILFKDFYKFLIYGLIMLLVCQTVNIFITNNFLNIVVQIIIGGITYCGILFVLKPAIMNFREIGIRN